MPNALLLKFPFSFSFANPTLFFTIKGEPIHHPILNPSVLTKRPLLYFHIKSPSIQFTQPTKEFCTTINFPLSPTNDPCFMFLPPRTSYFHSYAKASSSHFTKKDKKNIKMLLIMLNSILLLYSNFFYKNHLITQYSHTNNIFNI